MTGAGQVRWAMRVRRFAGAARLGLVATAPLVAGSVHPPIVAAGSVAAVLVLLLTLVPARSRGGWTRAHSIPWPVFAVLAGAAWMLAQAVPLPDAVLAALSPEGLETWRGADALWGRVAGAHPVSLDPPATRLQAARWLAVAALALSQAIAVRREGLRAVKALGVAILASGLAQAAVGLARLAIPGGLPALDAAIPAGAGFPGTFANPVQQAESLVLAALCALPAALESRSGPRRAGALVAFVACAACVLMVDRVGPWVGLSVAGVGLGVVSLVAGRKRGLPVAPRVAVVAALVLVAVAGAGALSLPRVLSVEPRDEDLPPARPWTENVVDVPDPAWSRATLAADTAAMAGAYPAVGVGTGAFASTFPRYNLGHPGLRFEHAECLPLEARVEGGWIGVLLLAATLLALVRSGVRTLSSATAAGPALALAALGIAEAAGAGVASNGVLLPAAALLGCVAAGAADRDGHTRLDPANPGPRGSRRGLFIGTLAVLGLVAGLAASALGRSEREDFDRVRTAAAEGGDVLAAAGEALARHPASYLPAAAAGEWLSEAGRGDQAVRWLDRARRQAPRDADVARLRALALLRSGRAAEARGVVGELAGRGGRSLSATLLELWRKAPVPEALVDLAPVPDPGRSATLEIATFLTTPRPDLAEAVLTRALAAVPGDAAFADRLGGLRIARGDLAGADRLATALLADFPRAAPGWLVAGRVAHARGRIFEALHLFREAAALAPDDPEPAFRAALALVDVGAPAAEVEPAVGRLNAVARGPDLRWRTAVLRSRLAEREGLVVSAADWLLEADRLRPRDHEILSRLARLSLRAGDHEGAATTLRRLVDAFPWDQDFRRELARLEPGPVGER